MRYRRNAITALSILLFAGFSYLAVSISRHGFSAKESPSWLEEFLARHVRKIATPSGSKQLKNPYPATPESLLSAREHWVDHCASCHALDGSGNTAMGRNLYPKAPDMRKPETQTLGDGELYYIIDNGVRFTGMPAWGGEHSPEETWQLVSFIRRLPYLPPEEIELMEQLTIGESGTTTKAHTHEGNKAHKHRH